jgi:ABC-type nitrate/sulfonate/bicarbonate transport system permease component
MPSIMADLRLVLNESFVDTISVEIISAKNGFSILLWFAWQTFRGSEIYSILVVIAKIKVVMGYIIVKLTIQLMP